CRRLVRCRRNGDFDRLRLTDPGRLRDSARLQIGRHWNREFRPTLRTDTALPRQVFLDVELVTVGAKKSNTHQLPSYAFCNLNLIISGRHDQKRALAQRWTAAERPAW